MAHQGIPTWYAGVRFRSRLESRWAAFFDLVGWPWLYEPLDLAGYIPDFLLPLGWGGEEKPLLVEVKPAQYVTELPAYASKILSSGWDGEALIVGGAIFEQYESGHDVPGVLLGADGSMGLARMFHCGECGRLSFAVCPGISIDAAGNITHHGLRPRQPCRLCGGTGEVSMGGHCVGSDTSDRLRSAVEAWTRAGNIVQWHGGAGA